MIDFSLQSWVEVTQESDFTIQNLPFGIFSTQKKSARVGVAIGNKIVDVLELVNNGFIDFDTTLFDTDKLNDFMALGRPVASKLRNRLQELLNENNDELRDSTHRGSIMVNMSEAVMHMPVQVGDYTDFYSSEDHARNVGTMFRDPNNALLPNWKHLPVGYHGRASSIVVSPAEIHRPKGQTKADDAAAPSFGPTRLFDFELEMAFITCKQTKLGESIPIDEAENAIWGMVIFNDLSARDIQKWEYVPLGPFLAKNFGSVISPWVVTMDALEPFRTKGYEQDPEVLPYLKPSKDANFDIHLEVALQPENGEAQTICTSNYKFMYWNMNQQLTHQTVNGCNINVGDMYASGTISGPEENQYGSMLELTWRGTKPITLSDGSERKFMQDGDTCIMRAHAEKEGVRVGFGEAIVKILPAT
ncbi:fumarylacetoacetase [Chitinophagales bacterium]|nr:fumarylacetoacetase [Chitinophagales bacterium]